MPIVCQLHARLCCHFLSTEITNTVHATCMHAVVSKQNIEAEKLHIKM